MIDGYTLAINTLAIFANALIMFISADAHKRSVSINQSPLIYQRCNQLALSAFCGAAFPIPWIGLLLMTDRFFA